MLEKISLLFKSPEEKLKILAERASENDFREFLAEHSDLIHDGDLMYNAMHISLATGNIDTLRVLIEYYLSGEINIINKPCLEELVARVIYKNDRDDIVSYLFVIADQNRDKFCFPFDLTENLIKCCTYGNVRIAALILRLAAENKVIDEHDRILGLNIKSNRYQPFRDSIARHVNSILKLLLEYHSNALDESTIKSLVWNAFYSNNPQAIEVMLSQGILADVNLSFLAEFDRNSPAIHYIKDWYNLESLAYLQKLLVNSKLPSELFSKANSGDEKLQTMLDTSMKRDLKPILKILLTLSICTESCFSLLPIEMIFNIAKFANEFNPSYDEVIAITQGWSKELERETPSSCALQ